MTSMKMKVGAMLVAGLMMAGLSACAGYDSLDTRVSKLEASNASMHRDLSKMKGHYKHGKKKGKKHEMGMK